MSKRKILLLAMSIIMIAILAVGGTLAYFTTEDQAENVFTLGNVEIDLQEEFEQDSEFEPGVEIEKKVWVENTGSKDAYVRAHIAIPANMDAQDPNKSGKEINKFLHFVYGTDANWSWNTGDANGKPTSTPNFYTATLENPSGEDELYNVYVVTYQSVLAPDASTGNVIEGVTLDTGVNSKASKEDGKAVSYTYIDVNGHKVTLPVDVADELARVSVKVYAEGTQTATFANAYEALNTAFGVPGSAGYVAPWNK